MSADSVAGLIEEARLAQDRGDMGRVIAATDEILKRDPKNFDALFLAGVAFLSSQNEGHALQFFNVARQLTTNENALAACWNNIGCCLQDYDPGEAYKAFHKALAGKGAPPESTFSNLCNVSSQIGKHEEALDWAAKAEATGGTGDIAYNKSFALFQLGRWGEAWPEYAKSIGKREGTDRDYGLRRRSEDDTDWSSCLVHGEQGIGDEILFLSMLPADFAGVIECNARNETLFARSWPQARVYGTLGQRELSWLGREVRNGLTHQLEMGGIGEFVGQAQPFQRAHWLSCDSARRAAHKAWLDVQRRRAAATDPSYAGFGRRDLQHRADGHAVSSRDFESSLRRTRLDAGRVGLTVGIAWTGGAWRTGRLKRSIPFEVINRLALVHGVTFVCLEYEDRRDLLRGGDWLNPHWATRKGADMDDLAALVSALDLVIAPTTSVVDLCGALGVECWALVDENPQWRYSDVCAPAGPDSMWFYESVRTFRQQARDNGKWDRVIGEVAAALRERVGMKVAAE